MLQLYGKDLADDSNWDCWNGCHKLALSHDVMPYGCITLQQSSWSKQGIPTFKINAQHNKQNFANKYIVGAMLKPKA